MAKLTPRQKELNKKLRLRKKLALRAEQLQLYERMQYLISKPEKVIHK